LADQVEAGFPFLPSGCHLSLDAVASKAVLDNIRESLPGNLRARAAELLRVADGGHHVTLQKFLDSSGLALEDVYSSGHSWSDLISAGGLPTLPPGPAEAILRRALGRLIHVDDPWRIERYAALAASEAAPHLGELSLADRRLFHMLATILMESVTVPGPTLSDAADLLWQHPQVLSELGQLMEVLSKRISHVQTRLATHPDVPMAVHARYTRREILAAFSDGISLKTQEWREGTRWQASEKVDLLAITMNKSGGRFSPTTRYRDYAISRELFHWESQSMTRAESETGRRYQAHAALGSSVLPFARLTTDERAFWLLGPAIYVAHEGERPMAITWKLTEPLSGDLFAAMAAAVA
jgi:hypothetical protein